MAVLLRLVLSGVVVVSQDMIGIDVETGGLFDPLGAFSSSSFVVQWEFGREEEFEIGRRRRCVAAE